MLTLLLAFGCHTLTPTAPDPKDDTAAPSTDDTATTPADDTATGPADDTGTTGAGDDTGSTTTGTEGDADTDSDTDSDGDVDTDTDTDTDADTDVDADSDSDADSDTDTTTSTGTSTGTSTTSPSACSTADLVFSAEVTDLAGAVGTSFAAGTQLVAVGVVDNPCAGEVVFTTPSTCLVDSVSMSGTSGTGMGVGVVCGAAMTTWSVLAGGRLTGAIEIGTLSIDTWTIEVGFNLPRTSASTTITVY